MPKNVKLNRRSVGTQSDLEMRGNDAANSLAGTGRRHLEVNAKFSSLRKKSAYRNLLQRSITIDAHGRVSLAAEGQGTSRATQTAAGPLENPTPGGPLRRAESTEMAMPPRSPEVSLGSSLSSVGSVLLAVEDPRTAKVRPEDLPGTSRFIPVMDRSGSASLQLDEGQASAEGSLAVIYSSDERVSFTSRVSNVGFVHEQQGLRRQSDEAVLLVQDYQSYDVLNTARRQEVAARAHPLMKLYKKRKRGRKFGAVRPIPIIPDSTLSPPRVCRICHEGEDVEQLIRPCLCKGSVGYIHATCLKIWLEQSNTSRCEICGYPYAIRQTRRYTKCVSVTVFLRTVVDRRALMYDLISFVAVTPLCIAGIAMCIRASVVSAAGATATATNFQMGNVTRAGMIMLSSTIIIAYSVWLYTLLSYHYKSWKRWYNSCYDVEVIPVYMTSQERLEALQRLEEQNRRRALRAEHGTSVVAVLQPHASYHPYGSFFHRMVSVDGRVHGLPQ